MTPAEYGNNIISNVPQEQALIKYDKKMITHRHNLHNSDCYDTYIIWYGEETHRRKSILDFTTNNSNNLFLKIQLIFLLS